MTIVTVILCEIINHLEYISACATGSVCVLACEKNRLGFINFYQEREGFFFKFFHFKIN